MTPLTVNKQPVPKDWNFGTVRIGIKLSQFNHSYMTEWLLLTQLGEWLPCFLWHHKQFCCWNNQLGSSWSPPPHILPTKKHSSIVIWETLFYWKSEHLTVIQNLLIYGRTHITLHYAHMHIHYWTINIYFKNKKIVANPMIIILSK